MLSADTTNYSVKLNRQSRFLSAPFYRNGTCSHATRSPNRSIINPFMIIHYTPTGVLNNSPNHNANEKGPLEQNYLLELGRMRSQN